MLAEPKQWTCPRCGKQLRIRKLPVHCTCGYAGGDDNGRESWDVEVNIWQRDDRLKICKACDKYNRERCSLIDLGCKRSFRSEVVSRAGICPQSKWPIIDRPARKRKQVSRPVITTSNLIYHVCPIASNNVWRLNVRQLKRRLHVFNGRKIVAVAYGRGLLPLRDVKREFNDDSIEWLPVQNDRNLREVTSFLPLLKEVESVNLTETTFYAHTKGNSTTDNALGAEMWRNAMYHHLLDHVHVVHDLLLTHPCVGTHKMVWPPDAVPPFPQVNERPDLNKCNWMFAGTFFWFRNALVFSQNWEYVIKDRYGAEAWLGLLFDATQGATVFQPWGVNDYPTPSPYDPLIYLWPMRDACL